MICCSLAKEVRRLSEVSAKKPIHIDDFAKEIDRRRRKGIFIMEFKVCSHSGEGVISCVRDMDSLNRFR